MFLPGDDGQQVRLILVPEFAATGQVVLVRTSDLAVKCVQVAA
jgi:hypothetical protein